MLASQYIAARSATAIMHEQQEKGSNKYSMPFAHFHTDPSPLGESHLGLIMAGHQGLVGLLQLRQLCL